MTPNFQTIVGFCAASGFLIVWLAFPSQKTEKSSNDNEKPFRGSGSNSPPPEEDEPDPTKQREEPPKARSTYSGHRPRWCDILHLEPNASPIAIRKAYARLMKGLHPDATDADEHTNAQCALVQEAYKEAIRDSRARS